MSIGGATYDLFVTVKHEDSEASGNKGMLSLPLGAKVRVDGVEETCGGGASNTAVGLQRLGCDAHFEGVIGSDQWGEALLKNLKKEGVRTDFATVVEGEVSSFSIILTTRSGERVILYEPGTNAHLHHANFDRDVATQMDWVYLNHIQEGSCVLQDDIVEILANERTHFTWNPGGYQIEAGMEEKNNNRLLRYTHFLLLNKEEALAFTRESTVERALSALLRAGAKSVCITDGGKGVVGTDGTGLYRCPCAPATVVDTTGAGDAFGTGATWALLTGKDFPTALRAGTINAASVVSAIGAQRGLLTETQILQRLSSTPLSVIRESL